MGSRQDDDRSGSDEAWLRAGRLLRMVDPERYARVLALSNKIVDAHLGEVDTEAEAVEVVPLGLDVDVDASSDLFS